MITAIKNIFKAKLPVSVVFALITVLIVGFVEVNLLNRKIYGV